MLGATGSHFQTQIQNKMYNIGSKIGEYLPVLDTTKIQEISDDIKNRKQLTFSLCLVFHVAD